MLQANEMNVYRAMATILDCKPKSKVEAERMKTEMAEENKASASAHFFLPVPKYSIPQASVSYT